MKQNISNIFYDKEIAEYTISDSVDDEGYVTSSETSTGTTFKGNISFDNLEQVREKYGIDEDIDIRISTHEDKPLGTIVGYDNVLYKIVGRIPSDSHNLLLGTKWSQKS
jgi:tryptophanase